MRDIKYQKELRKRGIFNMGNYTVAICSTVRDCARQLKKNIPNVEELRSLFKDSLVVIVENDSIDDTKQVLLNWKNTKHDVNILSEDTNEITIPSRQVNGVNPFYSKHRIERMAKFRNKYLEFLANSSIKIDFVIVIDLDISKISISGIIDSFGQPKEWDAIVSNGKKFLFKKLHWVFHDTYALIEIGETQPQTELVISQNRYKWQLLKKGMPLIPVVSGFNGMALYRYEAIRACRYDAIINKDPRVQVYCEHVSLHKQMINNGFNKIFINPSQIIFYREDLLKIIKTIWR